MPTVRVKRQIFILGYACILTGAPSLVHAQQDGWFFGLDLARSKLQLESPGVGFALRDDKDNSYKLSAGYQLNSNWKAELSYLDFSKPSFTAPVLGQPAVSDVRGKGVHLVGTGTLSITEKIGLYGKVGAFYSNLESGCTTTFFNCVSADRGSDVSLGLGVSYDFTKRVSVRGEWERFHRVGARDFTGQGDVDLFSVGMGLRF
jgi:OOP family OmpA-OmpF porin